MQRIHKATKGLPTLKLDVMVSCVGHAFQTCHVFWACQVITSNKCVAYSYWQNNFTTLFASGGEIDTAYQIYIFKIFSKIVMIKEINHLTLCGCVR